jgi:hypothetical protein
MQATGQLATLDLFPSGNVTNARGMQVTQWQYDPGTGVLDRKSYADGTTTTYDDGYDYDSQDQLQAVTDWRMERTLKRSSRSSSTTALRSSRNWTGAITCSRPTPGVRTEVCCRSRTSRMAAIPASTKA